MPTKDYQNLSTQASGSITKVTPFQVKSNAGFGSLAIDLEAFRGQFNDTIGDVWNTSLTTTTGALGNNISNVNLKNLANYLNANPGNNELRVLNKLSGSGDLAIQGSSALQGPLTVTGQANFGGNIASVAAGAKSIFANAGANTITIGGLTSTVALPTASFTGGVTITGDLTVNGTTTTINSTTLTVDDKNIILGAVAGAATDTGADGGGITLSGSTDHTIIWYDATDAWEFSEHVAPSTTNAKDLGLSAKRWKDLYVSGVAYFGSSTTDNKITLDSSKGSVTAGGTLILTSTNGDVLFDDEWRGGTTTAGSTAGIKLSSAGADWTTFNSNFPSSNSILGALNTVAGSTSNPRKLTYNISASYSSGTNVPVNLGLFAGGTTFTSTVMTDKNALVFYNGQLIGSGSTANVTALPAIADYSVDAGLGSFKFGFPVSPGDVVVVKLD